MQISLASNSLNIVTFGLIYLYSVIPFLFVKNRHTLTCRKTSERVGGKLIKVPSLGSEGWELRGEKRIFIFLIPSYTI